MDWKNIEDIKCLNKDCELLFRGIYNTHIDYYLGYRMGDEIFVDDELNRDRMEIERAVKCFHITHYCVIIPPIEDKNSNSEVYEFENGRWLSPYGRII